MVAIPWAILVVVLVLGLLGLLFRVAGNLIHVLLIVALALLVSNPLVGRRRLSGHRRTDGTRTEPVGSETAAGSAKRRGVGGPSIGNLREAAGRRAGPASIPDPRCWSAPEPSPTGSVGVRRR